METIIIFSYCLVYTINKKKTPTGDGNNSPSAMIIHGLLFINKKKTPTGDGNRIESGFSSY